MEDERTKFASLQTFLWCKIPFSTFLRELRLFAFPSGDIHTFNIEATSRIKNCFKQSCWDKKMRFQEFGVALDIFYVIKKDFFSHFLVSIKLFHVVPNTHCNSDNNDERPCTRRCSTESGNIRTSSQITRSRNRRPMQ